MSALTTRLAAELHALGARSRRRGLSSPDGIDFSSNDYLGLSDDPRILNAVARAASGGVPHGSTGSRLLSGNHPSHRLAEEGFAAYVGRESALLFGNGFAANLSLLSALPGRHDLILLDAAAHASLKEGARAGLATRRSFPHNDVEAARRALRDRGSFRDLFIVVEGVYSMDGDAAPLTPLFELADETGAHLIVDEAHATGLFGERLRGMHAIDGLARKPLATVHPCGKALGSSGAFVAADAVVIDYLVNTARPFLFSTAPAPLQGIALAAVIELLPSMEERAAELLDRTARFREHLSGLATWRTIPAPSPIVPVIVGDDAAALAAAIALQREGFDVRPIRPPTVPEGSARLRISITWKRTPEELERLADAILRLERQGDSAS